MTRKTFLKKIKKKCDRLWESHDLDYQYEEIPIPGSNGMIFQILCNRVEKNMVCSESDIGSPITFEFYVQKDEEYIDGVTVDPYLLNWISPNGTRKLSDIYLAEADYLLQCVTKWK